MLFRSPSITCRSVRHTAQASTLTISSPGFGLGTGTWTGINGVKGLLNTMANIRVGGSVVATLETVGPGNPASSRNPRPRNEPLMWLRKCRQIFRSYRILCPEGTVGLSLGFQPQVRMKRAPALKVAVKGCFPSWLPNEIPNEFLPPLQGGVLLSMCPGG